MKQSFILLALCVLCCSCSIDYGDPATLNYAIDGSFSKLEVSDAFQVTVSDKVSDVVVTVGEKALDKVVVKVKSNKLYIGMKPFTNYSGITATAVIPSNIAIDDIELSGASWFTGELKGDVVKIDLSGASKYLGDVEANSLKVYLSGSAACMMKGACQNTMHIRLSGASHLQASGVNAQSVKGSMSGGSYAEVTCCTDLIVHLSGASHLVYETVDKDCRVAESCEVSGGSTVQRMSDNK